MKRRLIFFLTLTLAILLTFASCIQMPSEPPAETTGNANLTPNVTPEELHVYLNTSYVYHSLVDETLLTTGLSPAYLILANKTSTLSSSYNPSDLVDLRRDVVIDSSTLQLERRAAEALYQMMKELRADGYDDLLVTSAFRTYSNQVSLFNTYMEREQSGFSKEAIACLGADYLRANYYEQNKTGLSPADARRVVLSYSAAPGTSEHQTGLCVDFVSTTLGDVLDESFEDTAVFDWLAENAYKFGFILRYPKDKVEITGYTYEPWHYRFVGREAATDIHFSGLSLEEYLLAVQQ